MEVQYKREMNHNYMIIDAPSEYGGYECQMLAENSIDGLLKFRAGYQEEKKQFYYEITSRQPLARVLEKRKITGEEIRCVMMDIISVLERIEEYLLKEEQVLLSPEFIYVDPDYFRVSLCVLPGYVGDLPEAFSKLLKFLLEKVDHQDRDGVVIAYNLYQESQKENYGLCGLRRHLFNGNDLLFCREEAKTVQEGAGKREVINRGGREQPEIKEVWEDEAEEISLKQKTPYRLEEKRNFYGGVKRWIWIFLILIGIEGIIWYLMGGAGVRSYGIWAAAGVLFLELIKGIIERYIYPDCASAESESAQDGIKGLEWREKKAGTEKIVKDSQETDCSRWEIQPESEEEYHKKMQQKEKERIEKSREEGTMLLTKPEGTGYVAILEPLNHNEEAIMIPYVPFVIGKHTELSDYALKWPEISRLHLRFDKKEKVCIITDLNSTNGTSVNGYMLQANETVSIKNGDILCLAGIGYKFIE